MVIIQTINKNILDSKELYIAQQCNCNTIKSHGLSNTIANHFGPWADPYSRRTKKGPNSTTLPDTPGKIVMLKKQNHPLHILCLMAQWLPGKPGRYASCYPKTYIDTYENRKIWFQNCLDIMDKQNYGRVAMPYGIGCGLAGGKWEDYEKMLTECKTEIILYKI